MDFILGQIVLFPYGFAPMGWQVCNGQTLNVMQYQAVYSLLGNRFGGNGPTTFCVPNLQGAEPVPGMGYYICMQGIYPTRE